MKGKFCALGKSLYFSKPVSLVSLKGLDLFYCRFFRFHVPHESLSAFLKKAALFIALYFAVLTGYATTYYLSSTGNDTNDGTSMGTPWKTINQLNATRLKAGDSVLFHQGDIFYGTIRVNSSGNPGRVIYYGSYGTGANPIISGFTAATSWTSLGGNIWETTNPISTLSSCNLVLVNGADIPMGRYPNSGYLTIQSHSGNQTITSAALSGSPNWTGAEVVIKKNRWIIDRNVITSQAGGTLTYKSSSSYDARDQFGFFIQNDVRTLDAPNEWYYNPSTKKIRIFSSGTPSNIQVATVDTLVYMLYKNYITFSNLSFVGANRNAFFIGSSSNLTIQNCSIDFSYNGISSGNWGQSSANFVLKNSTLNHTHNNGISTSTEFVNASITYNTIKNTSLIPGMGGSGDGSSQGMSISGKNSIVQYNVVDTAGFIGIAFSGNTIQIDKNFINYFCLIKDDGGGIYTQGNEAGNIISNNVILNGIGNGDGSPTPLSSAMGIYLDNNSSGIQILNNSLGNIGFAGIYLHDAHDIVVKNNTVYNCRTKSIWVKNDDPNTFIRNITIANNILVARDSTQNCFQAVTLHNDIPSFGTINNNYYARPLDDNLVFIAQPTGDRGRNDYYSLAGWQKYTGYDANSHGSPKKITDKNDLRYEYNSTQLPVTVSLPYSYIDITGAVFNGAIKLAPYSSAVLIKSGPITNMPPKANAGSDQTITLPVNNVNLSGTASDSDGTVTKYVWTMISGPSVYTIATGSALNTAVTGLVQGVYKFELKVTDNIGATASDTVQITVNPAAAPPNVPPVANAGADQTITLPVNNVNLSGTASDSDGSLASFAWTKIAGPSGFTIATGSALNTAVTGLMQGVYKFELKVTDNKGASTKDTVQVTVNPAVAVPPPVVPVPNVPPVANAGADQTITLPVNNVNLSGTASDSDGSLASFAWTKIAGPSGFTIATGSALNTAVTGLVQGVYKFELKVTDNKGASTKDTVQVTVNPAVAVPPPVVPVPNVPPVANAGADQTITLPVNNVNLSGTASDSDGSLASFAWTQIAGPSGFTIATGSALNTAVTGLMQGVYKFELKVTDNKGASTKDTVQVTVNPAVAVPPPVVPVPNVPPVANAGADQTITLPVNNVNLSGTASDSDGSLASFAWTEISGPSGFTIATGSALNTAVTGLVQGVYKFELKVTDNKGASTKDTVQVTVNPAVAVPPPVVPVPNVPPVANAGADQTITLPVNNVNLSGTASDSDGSLASFAWTKIAGPSGFTIATGSALNTAVTGLVQGVYKFELKVTDNKGASTKDTVQVTVNPAVAVPPPVVPVPNVPPVANAGADQTITLPVNNVNLSGTASDSDGSLASFAWTQIAGPSGFTIATGSALNTAVTGLMQGVYKFELKVTDNKGASTKDTVQVTVNPAVAVPPPVVPVPNVPPVANAGADQTITLPVNNVNLSGTASDSDGSLASFAWTKLQVHQDSPSQPDLP